MKETHAIMNVVWLKTNGAYAVMFGEQLIPIDGKVLFAYRHELETALDNIGLFVRDFEGAGRIYTCVNS